MATVTKPIVTDETAARMADAIEAIADAQKRITLTIQMLGTDNTQVPDENIIITDAATGVALFTIPYFGAPVSVSLARDSVVVITGSQTNAAHTGYYAPTKNTIVVQSSATITIVYQVMSAGNSLAALQEVVQANPDVEILPIGTEVTLPCTDDLGAAYDWTFVVAHYGYVVKESDKDTGKLSWCMFLLTASKTRQTCPYCANPGGTVATESTASSELYYYGYNGSTYTLLAIGANGEGGETVPYSDWTAVYHIQINELFNKYTSWYRHSTIRNYINAEGTIGEWWQPSYVGQREPAIAQTKKGLLSNFRDVDRAAMTAIAVPTYNNVFGSEALDVTYDKVYLASTWELYCAGYDGEGDPWSAYFKDFCDYPYKCPLGRPTIPSEIQTVVNRYGRGGSASYTRSKRRDYVSVRSTGEVNQWRVGPYGANYSFGAIWDGSRENLGNIWAQGQTINFASSFMLVIPIC